MCPHIYFKIILAHCEFQQHYHAMPTTIGHLDPPLGNTRLQVVRLITSLLITNTHSVNQELANLGTIAVIIVSNKGLFFEVLILNKKI